jgi:hypothetical protein
VKRLALLALTCSGLTGNAFGDIEQDRIVPALFEQGTVFLALPAPDHSTLRVYTDSGAGPLTLSTEAARRLQLSPTTTENEKLLSSFGPNVRVTLASEYMLHTWPVLATEHEFVVIPGVVAFAGWPADADGGLGNSWFAGHTWTWDYPRQELILRTTHWRPSAAAHEIAVAFKADDQGHRQFNFPRISIRVDDADIPVLFDTGAATVLTPGALRTLHDGQPARRATCMIVHSVFEAWHARHPGWRIVNDAQLSTHSRMILVPSVKIAGIDAGPVWFTEREDEDFHQMLAPMMDAQVDGALGGSALGRLAISLNYLASRAWVSKANSSRH